MRIIRTLTTLPFALALGAVPTVATAQAPAVAPSCAAEFAWLRDYAERNYAGFEYKVPDSVTARYGALVDSVAADAARASDSAACTDALERWVAFFHDGHLSIARRNGGAATTDGDESPAAIRARYVDAPIRAIDEAEARARLDALGAARHPIEGIWEMQGGNYRGVVLRDDEAATSYSMSILRADSVWWMPGQVKASFVRDSDGAYPTRFLMRDHSERRWTGRVRGNVLRLDGGSPWLRQYPALPGDLDADRLAALANSRFTVDEPVPGTVVLHVPSFDDPSAMDSLWKADSARISAAQRLIIDVRGNGGGSDHNFRMLIPLVYTGPIRMVSNALLATPDNIAVNEALAADTALPRAIRNSILASVRRMREAKGRWYAYDNYVIDDLKPLARPATVDIVLDRGCASSCEQFLLAARQSGKVTLYGERSAGILDFGNVRQAQMPGGTLLLNYPTTRSQRLPAAPVDGVGIQPAVIIPETEPDPVGWLLRHPTAPRP